MQRPVHCHPVSRGEQCSLDSVEILVPSYHRQMSHTTICTSDNSEARQTPLLSFAQLCRTVLHCHPNTAKTRAGKLHINLLLTNQSQLRSLKESSIVDCHATRAAVIAQQDAMTLAKSFDQHLELTGLWTSSCLLESVESIDYGEERRVRTADLHCDQHVDGRTDDEHQRDFERTSVLTEEANVDQVAMEGTLTGPISIDEERVANIDGGTVILSDYSQSPNEGCASKVARTNSTSPNYNDILEKHRYLPGKRRKYTLEISHLSRDTRTELAEIRKHYTADFCLQRAGQGMGDTTFSKHVERILGKRCHSLRRQQQVNTGLSLRRFPWLLQTDRKRS